MKRISVYARETEWVLAGMSRTTTGLWIANFSVERLSIDCPDELLGECVQKVLETSRTDIPHPHWAEFHRRYAGCLGAGTIAGFEKTSRLIIIEQIATVTILTPHSYRASREGFEPVSPKTELARVDAVGLGKGIRESCKRCG